jgi:hypothetical protein
MHHGADFTTRAHAPATDRQNAVQLKYSWKQIDSHASQPDQCGSPQVEISPAGATKREQRQDSRNKGDFVVRDKHRRQHRAGLSGDRIQGA